MYFACKKSSSSCPSELSDASITTPPKLNHSSAQVFTSYKFAENKAFSSEHTPHNNLEEVNTSLLKHEMKALMSTVPKPT